MEKNSLSTLLIILCIMAGIIGWYYWESVCNLSMKPSFREEWENGGAEVTTQVRPPDVLSEGSSQSQDEFTESGEQTRLATKDIYLDIGPVDFLRKNTPKRLVITLYDEAVPQTADNFRTLCHQKKYRNIPFHRVIKDFMVQGGDITNRDGTGGESVFGGKFPDENLSGKHRRGVISMANSGPDTNLSQFFIVTSDSHHLDGKHVVFGKVI